MSIVDTAKSFAYSWHSGQLDKQGRDYFAHHLLPVSEMTRALGEGFRLPDDMVDRAVAVAWLHDVLEDTPAEYEDLVADGLGDLADDIWALTKDALMSYAEYIDALTARGSGTAVLVKLADNMVNATTLTALDPPTADRLRAKYRAVRPMLFHALWMVAAQEGSRREG